VLGHPEEFEKKLMDISYVYNSTYIDIDIYI
jgi:hypothetical protein